MRVGNDFRKEMIKWLVLLTPNWLKGGSYLGRVGPGQKGEYKSACDLCPSGIASQPYFRPHRANNGHYSKIRKIFFELDIPVRMYSQKAKISTVHNGKVSERALCYNFVKNPFC